MSRGPAELLEADRRCLSIAEVFLDAIDDHPSAVGYRRLGEAIDAARERAGRHRTETLFDELLVRHLQSSWRVLESVARYRFHWPEVPVSELVEALAGEDAVARLESFVSGIDPEDAWSYIEQRHGYRAGRVPAERPDVRPLVEQSAARIAEAFREWISSRGWRLPGLDAEVMVAQGQVDHSWYQPAQHLVVLGGSEFMVFERDGALSVNPAVALRGLAHELAGHAVQNALSRTLPVPLRPDDRSRLRFATLPIAEGYATHAATLAPVFAREQGEALGLDERDLASLERMDRMSALHHAVPALVSVLAARARQEAGFDPVAYMADRCGLPGFGEILEDANREPAYRLIYDNASFFGGEQVRRTALELSTRGIDEGAALRALGSGAWALDCYHDAVLAGAGVPVGD